MRIAAPVAGGSRWIRPVPTVIVAPNRANTLGSPYGFAFWLALGLVFIKFGMVQAAFALRRSRLSKQAAGMSRNHVDGSGVADTVEAGVTATLNDPLLLKLCPAPSDVARNRRVAPVGMTKVCAEPVPFPVSPSPMKNTTLSPGDTLDAAGSMLASPFGAVPAGT